MDSPNDDQQPEMDGDHTSQSEEVIEALTRTLTANPTIAGFLIRALAYFDRGEWQAAVDDVQHAISMDTSRSLSSNVQLTLGSALRNLGRSDEAEQYLLAATKGLKPERTQQLLASIEKFLQLMVSADMRTDALPLRARLLYELGDYEGCATDCTEILERDPSRIRTCILRSRAYRHLGKHLKALADCDQAIRYFKDDPEKLLVLAQHRARIIKDQTDDSPKTN